MIPSITPASTPSSPSTSLTQHESIARQLIHERTASARRSVRLPRRHTRTAGLLRRLAERLDPPTTPEVPARVSPGWAPARPAAARN